MAEGCDKFDKCAVEGTDQIVGLGGRLLEGSIGGDPETRVAVCKAVGGLPIVAQQVHGACMNGGECERREA